MKTFTASCPDAEEHEVNPLFIEFDTRSGIFRFICACGDVHARQVPEHEMRHLTKAFRGAGCRIFAGLDGDIALAGKD